MKLKKRLASFAVAGIMAVISCVSLASSAVPQHLKYDANGDGEVGLADAVYVSQYLGGAFEPENLDLCDVDRNGVVSEMDVRKIQYHCMGMLGTKGERVDDNVNNANTVNSDVKYRVYNAQTGDELEEREYTLSKLGSSNKARAVIGDDQRVVDWTKSGVVKIITNYDEEYYSISSGFVVSDHVIATAAHCVYNKKISKILLFDSNGKKLDFDSNGKKSDSVTPVEYHVPVDYINALAENNNEYTPTSDYALITVSDNLKSFNNFKLGVTLKSFDKSDSLVTVTGFPGTIGKRGKEVDVNDDMKHFMYTGSGAITYNKDVDDKLITYVADTSGGNSGGPVYITKSLNDETYYTVVGINVAHPDEDKPKYNIGTRMTTDLIHFYNNNQNLKW